MATQANKRGSDSIQELASMASQFCHACPSLSLMTCTPWSAKGFHCDELQESLAVRGKSPKRSEEVSWATKTSEKDLEKGRKVWINLKETLLLGDKIQGPSWGQQKGRTPSSVAQFGLNFEARPKWLKVASGSLKWLKVAYSAPPRRPWIMTTDFLRLFPDVGFRARRANKPSVARRGAKHFFLQKWYLELVLLEISLRFTVELWMILSVGISPSLRG